MKIQTATAQDIKQCAKILMDIYNSNVLSEGWTTESSNAICKYYFEKQPDLFLVAKDKEAVIGFTFSYVKPWADGNQLMVEEISVDERYRRQGVAKKLLLTLLKKAKRAYKVTCVNGATYLGENNMPFSWYERIGFEKVDDLFLIQGKTDDIISKL